MFNRPRKNNISGFYLNFPRNHPDFFVSEYKCKYMEYSHRIELQN